MREASQAILLAELRRIGFDCRKKIVETWAPQLPKKLDDLNSTTSGSETSSDVSHQTPPSPQLYGMYSSRQIERIKEGQGRRSSFLMGGWGGGD